jgi:hypothetical protein
MVDDELTDGRRIGQLLSSEIHGHERGALGRLSVVEADTEVEPTEAGAFAYAIEYREEDDGEDDGEGESQPDRIAEVYVHPDRAHVEFRVGVETAVEAAEGEGLRVRPKAVEPPRTLVFAENGAEVKGALRVIRTVTEERADRRR